MNKNLLIGAGIVVIGGAVAASALLNGGSGEKNIFNIPQQQADPQSDGKKIEELYFDELQNEDRYVFCIGKETISGDYKNTIAGIEEGEINYVSNDLSVFDKDSNKLYILGRSIDYHYSGNADLSSGAGQGILQINESGNTVEYYKKNSAPVRIDHNSKTLFPAPERKKSDWVAIVTKSTGTVMGVTQTSTEEETGDAKTLCSYFSLAGDPLKNGAVITPEFFSFKGRCPDYSPNPGISFSGNFEFECSNIDSKQGVELLKDYKEREEMRDAFNNINNDLEPQEDNGLKDAIDESEPVQSPEDIQGKLDELKNEMKADQQSR